jgi:hypothetical protein
MIDKFNYPEKYEEKKLSLFDFIDKFIEESKKRINPDTGRLISDSTLKKYTTCFNYLKDFAAKKNRTIDFDDIDLEFYDDFVEFLSVRELGAWTGCRFSDLDQIHPRNINGQKIKIKQYKTDHKVTIPLYPVVISILEKYGNDLPRVLTNQKMNEYLKELGQLAGFNEPFHKKK